MLSGRRLRLATPIALALAALALAGCGEDDEPAAGLELSWQRPEPRDAEAARVLRDAGLINAIVAGLNESIELPEPVEVRIRSGGGEAFYDDRRRRIVMTYPFARAVARTFAREFPGLSARAIEARVRNVTAFVLLHEAGHALVDVLDLPVTAREEDSVDNLATVISVATLPRGDNVALDFADFSAPLDDRPARLAAIDFWDEHSLDAQRANETTCLVFGSDPDRNRELAELIPRFRRQLCRDEWRQISRSWRRLLEPHLTSEGGAALDPDQERE